MRHARSTPNRRLFESRGAVLLTFLAASIAAVGGCGGGSTAASDDPAKAKKVGITISSPSDQETVRASRVTVRGTVTPSSASVKVFGSEALVSNGFFTKSVKLESGRNRIDVAATADGYDPATSFVTVKRGRTKEQIAAAVKRKKERAAQKRAASGGGSGSSACPDLTGPSYCFEGNGMINLGTIVINVPSVVTWTAGSPDFVFDGLGDNGQISIRSDATTGSSMVSPDTYRDSYASVIGADKSWTIRINPQ